MSFQLNEIYRSVLKYAGLEADNLGFISTVLDTKRTPTVIGGLQLVLPLDNQLRSFDAKQNIIFHPLTENILRGESEVIAKLKSIINVRLNYTIGTVAVNLLKLLASPEYHGKLNPEQLELITSVADADEKTQVNFVSLMVAGIRADPEGVFTRIYLKRGGTYKGKRYSRVGIVNFPFYEKIMEDKVEKIRVKDKETFRQLFEFMFPNISVAEEYNFGSESQVAPYLEALLRSSSNIAARLNDLLTTYSDFIDDAEKIMFDSDWTDYFQDLNALIPEIRKVPMQHGNDGSITLSEETTKAPAYVANNPPQTAAPYQQPAMQPTAPNGYPQPVQPQVQQPPGVKVTKRGIDFQSLLQNNQAVAMAPNALGSQLAMQNYQQQMANMQQTVPGWAQPQQPMMYPGMPQYPQQPQLPPGVFMTPNGPMMMTPNGPMPVNLNMPPQQQVPGWAQPQQPYYR